MKNTLAPVPETSTETDAARYHRLRFEHDHADVLAVIGEAITIKPERILKVARALKEAGELMPPRWERYQLLLALEEQQATVEDHDSNCHAPDHVSSLEHDVEVYEGALDQIKGQFVHLMTLNPDTNSTLCDLRDKILEIVREARS